MTDEEIREFRGNRSRSSGPDDVLNRCSVSGSRSRRRWPPCPVHSASSEGPRGPVLQRVRIPAAKDRARLPAPVPGRQRQRGDRDGLTSSLLIADEPRQRSTTVQASPLVPAISAVSRAVVI
jgi:hypothetical protein